MVYGPADHLNLGSFVFTRLPYKPTLSSYEAESPSAAATRPAIISG